MNNQRRANLRNAQAILRKAQESIKIAYDIAEDAKGEEEDCMLCMPENLQESDRYYEMEDRVDSMEDILLNIDTLDNSVDEIVDSIDTVM